MYRAAVYIRDRVISLSGSDGLKQLSRLTHAYIADGHVVSDLSMAVVCKVSAESGALPCRNCKHCDKASKRIHPDIISIDRIKDKSGETKREITVDQIREIKNDVYIAPNEAARKVYIINDAETMNKSAQNAFLQMLEEPPPHVVFILNTKHPAMLLPTVRSRCVQIKPPPQEHTQHSDDSESAQPAAVLARDFAAALDDNMLLTKCMFSIEKLDRTAFAEFITFAREELSLKLRKNPHLKSAVTADDLLVNATEMLGLNVSVGHISGLLCASLIKS